MKKYNMILKKLYNTILKLSAKPKAEKEDRSVGLKTSKTKAPKTRAKK